MFNQIWHRNQLVVFPTLKESNLVIHLNIENVHLAKKSHNKALDLIVLHNNSWVSIDCKIFPKLDLQLTPLNTPNGNATI